MKKIECTERKLFNIDITVNTLKKLKRKHSANPVFPPLKVLLSFA